MRSSFARFVVGVAAFLCAILGAVSSAYLTYQPVRATPAASTRSASTRPASTRPASTQPASAPSVADSAQGLFDRICTGFSGANCEKVGQSRYARFPFGRPAGQSVPTSELGLVYFIFVVCWLLLIGSATASRWWVHLLFVLVTAFGLGTSVFLDVVMWTRLAYWCPLCLTAHVASLAVFLCALLLWPRRPRADAPVVIVASQSAALAGLPGDAAAAPAIAGAPQRRPWPTFHAVVATLVAFLLAAAAQHLVWLRAGCQKEVRAYKWYGDYWRKQFNRYDDRWQFVYMSWMYEPALPLVLEGEPARGPANARHTIVLFSDLQCPACTRLEDILRTHVVPAAARYGGVRVIYKHYPICLECNPGSGSNLHPEACLASRAVEAARIVGGDGAFWRLHDALLADRERMKGADRQWFVRHAEKLNLDPAAFARAMDSREANDRIRRHIAEAENLGKGVVPEHRLDDYRVTSTPTVLVDHRYLRTTRHQRVWEEIFRNPPPAPPAVSAGGSSASRPEGQRRVIFGSGM